MTRRQNPAHQTAISDIADDKRNLLGYQCRMARRKIIKHYNAKSSIEQGEYDMTPNIAGTSSH
jgi:hypothetical protein